MIDEYKRVVDTIKASEELQGRAVLRIRSTPSKGKVRFHTYRYTGAAACILIAVLGAALFLRSPLQPVPKSAPRGKVTMEYAPGTLQARAMAEKVTVINTDQSGDYKGPVYKDIRERYAGSQAVIKGYVYSTEYIWHHFETHFALYTKSVIVIEKNYKGSLKTGEMVTVFERGGVTTLKEWIENSSRYATHKDFGELPGDNDPYNGKSSDDLVENVGFGRIPVMKTGEDVVLFLSPENFEFLGEAYKTAYRLNGYDGGKMLLKGRVYEAQVSPWFQGLIEGEKCREGDIDEFIDSIKGGN